MSERDYYEDYLSENQEGRVEATQSSEDVERNIEERIDEFVDTVQTLSQLEEIGEDVSDAMDSLLEANEDIMPEVRKSPRVRKLPQKFQNRILDDIELQSEEPSTSDSLVEEGRQYDVDDVRDVIGDVAVPDTLDGIDRINKELERIEREIEETEKGPEI